MPPEIVETLMAQGGRHRVAPTFLQYQVDQAFCRVTTVQP